MGSLFNIFFPKKRMGIPAPSPFFPCQSVQIMKKIFFLHLISILSINLSYSQKDDLFLLVAHPFYDADPFPSYLLSLNFTAKTLDTIKRLSTGKETLREVKYYLEHKKIIMVKEGEFGTENTHKAIQFLNIDPALKLDSVNLDTLKSQYLYSCLFNLNDKESYFCVQLSNPKLSEEDFLWGIEISNLRVKKLVPENFKNVEIVGNPGTCLLAFDGLAVYTNPQNGELRIPETIDISKRPIFPIQLPKEFQPQKTERRPIVINNSSAFVFSAYNSQTSKIDIGFTDLTILDKSANVWFKQRIKGNADIMIRSFNNWVAGTVCADNKVFDKEGRITDKIKRVSPGKEKRRKKMTKTGIPADYRFDYLGYYSSGILYLLNVSTRDYIEWNTGQGDSEILLVENNTVYYRVNDEIYEAVVEGKKLGKAQLLIKHEMVPDIHWAFKTK